MRLIDDALEGGQNGATRSRYTHGHLVNSMSHRARTLSNVSVVAVSNRFQESVQAGTRRTKLGRLGCDGTVESTRGSSCVYDNTGQSCTIITHAAIHLGIWSPAPQCGRQVVATLMTQLHSNVWTVRQSNTSWFFPSPT